MTSAENRPVLLEARDIVVHYGRIKALHGVSLVVHEGEFVTLLGSNGAGKTTTMRTISGLRRLTSGSVWFEGRDITGVKAHKRVIDGLIQAPEGRGVFPGMTVVENLEMGCYGRKFASKAEHNERLDWVLETFPRLAERSAPGGRHAVRWRAADAGDRPRADGPAEGAAARRAVDGSGADGDLADLRDHRRDQLPGHDGAARRAERAAGADPFRSGLHTGDR